MQIDTNTRIEHYKNANVKQQFLFGSFETAKRLGALIEKYHLDESVGSEFIITIGDIVLGFYKIEDTVPLLQQELGLDAKTAALLGADVLDFLAPLSDPNWQPPAEQDSEQIGEAPEPTVNTSESLPEIPANEPITLVTTELPELRTMAADMVEGRSPVRNTFNAAAAIDEPVYVSTQPTIEKKAPDAPSYAAPLYQPPKPNVDAPLEKPRWG